MEKYEITLKGSITHRAVGTITLEAETPEHAHDVVFGRLRAEKFIETDDGTIHKTEFLSDNFGMRRVKPRPPLTVDYVQR